MIDKKKRENEPWNISYRERLNKITKTNKKKVVYIYGVPDTSTFRYRVYNVCQSLKMSKTWVGSYFFENELDMLEKELDKMDVVVFSRTHWTPKIEKFLNEAKFAKIPALFDIDDIVCDIEKIPLVMNTLNVDFNHENCQFWFGHVSRIWLIAKMCDGYICTNDYLADQLRQVFNKKTYVINNFLNTEQIEISNSLFARRRYFKAKTSKKFIIGYFSGTPSHINDFKKISSEIYNLLKKYPNIRLDVVGFMQFPDYLNEFIANERIIHHPLVDFIELQNMIANVDVNIIPLVDNEFTNCKSELKFFEAAIVGAVTCATPTFVYRENIVNGENGYLCGEGDWERVIEQIYKNGVDTRMINSARSYCLGKYSPNSQLEAIELVLNDIKRAV